MRKSYAVVGGREATGVSGRKKQAPLSLNNPLPKRPRTSCVRGSAYAKPNNKRKGGTSRKKTPKGAIKGLNPWEGKGRFPTLAAFAGEQFKGKEKGSLLSGHNGNSLGNSPTSIRREGKAR